MTSFRMMLLAGVLAVTACANTADSDLDDGPEIEIPVGGETVE
ncbi:hypothetical protein N825_01875 [Skermanella stibiiresistens SB22]|uniref:Uncharacterized protein n=1 Tax=Skermanella stibiiresistens SB22 TaxID=1385369 RepID=W9HA57_9PROT|nr:hypothetical protein [Skermanella stibiiresistens]EWY42859.1 hypothetical protein N825_01875 [Skermanella stibiiresistens SB22]